MTDLSRPSRSGVDDLLPESLVPPGTNVLVRGPAMTGKRRLARRFLAGAGADERATYLSTTDAASTVRREFRPADGHPLLVVDAVTRQNGTPLDEDDDT